MSKIKRGSFWLSVLEQIINLCPTLGLILYYYFSEIEKTVTWSSKLTFGMALALLVILVVYSKVFKSKIKDKKASLIQSETDLINGVGDPIKISEHIAKDKLVLNEMTRAKILIVLFIIALSVYVLEQATIGLTTLVSVGVASVATGMGIEVAVVKLEEKENKKGADTNGETGNKK